MHKPSSRDDEGIVPYEFYEGSRNNGGIATPVCGLVRNDMRGSREPPIHYCAIATGNC